jgi:hypothetical protein
MLKIKETGLRKHGSMEGSFYKYGLCGRGDKDGSGRTAFQGSL